MVEAEHELEESDKEACRVVLRYLELGYDAVLDEDEHPGDKYGMMFTWCMLAPKEYTALVAAKNVLALRILVQYARYLEYGEALWQVGGAGKYILEILGPHCGTD